MDNTMLDLCETFVAECMDYIDELEPQFIELSKALVTGQSETSMQLMNHIFRLIHTIKGSAGSLGFQNISSLAHRAENLLDLVRHKRIALTPERLNLLTKCLDIFRVQMAHLQTNQTDVGTEHLIAETCHDLDRAILEDTTHPTKPVAMTEASPGLFLFDEPIAPLAPEMQVTDAMRNAFVQESEEALTKIELCLLTYQDPSGTDRAPQTAEALRLLHSFKGNCGFIRFVDMESLVHAMETCLQDIKNGVVGDDKIDELLKCNDILRGCLSPASEKKVPKIENLKSLLRSLTADAGNAGNDLDAEDSVKTGKVIHATQEIGAGSRPPTAIQRSDVRVDLKKLDALINLVGELVVAEAMVTGWANEKSIEDDHLERAVHHLRRTTLNLQDIAMSVRMVPVNQTFKKLIRLVHDTSAKLGKKVRLNLVGEETEIDKTVIEQISDPLVHCVRNSIDHGLETIENRKRAGKDETGTITLEARHEGGEVWIIIHDDGGGLSREKILARARERGLVTAEREISLSDSEVFNFIFEAGFSTAEKVTDISGRGVGMDVVRKNIEKVKGSIRVESEAGQGTRVTFQIPLTLAIIDGMMIRVGASKYTVPLLSIQESIRIKPEQITTGPDGQDMLDVRSRFIPIIRLDEMMLTAKDAAKNKDLIVVVVEVHKKSFALLVDEILGQQQTVIKALPTMYKHSKNVSGCSILPNGDVSLIIDIAGIANKLNNQYESFVTHTA